jgi:hypothetical protein
MSRTCFKDLVGGLRETLAGLHDRRTGDNCSYAMVDFGLSAFAVFFTQSPSFLAHQKAMQTARGGNNAQSLFGIQNIPCDNQIRDQLDPVPPQSLFPVYDDIYDALREQGILQTFRGVHDSTLIALDGTWYHSSQKIHCACCSSLEHTNGQTTYYHSALTPVIVAPGRPEVISLRPEFITPQDGHTKQDCEIAAAKRWLEQNTTLHHPLSPGHSHAPGRRPLRSSTLLSPRPALRLPLPLHLQARLPSDPLPLGEPAPGSGPGNPQNPRQVR